MKIIKYFLIFFCFVLAILGDILDFAMKIIQVTIFLSIIGVLGSILIKITIDILINTLIFLTQIFDENNNKNYKGIKNFLFQNRKIILNFLLGILPENISFIFGAAFGDIIPFRTLAIIIIFLLEIGIFEKLIRNLKLIFRKISLR